ncbi:MAG: hypothetical protein WCJ62_04040 [Flavobacterium sp.]
MDILFILFIIGLGLLFINSFKTKLESYNISILQKLFFYHLIFGVYYCFFIQGDSIGYWRVPKSINFKQAVEYFHNSEGTFFLIALNYFPSNVLGLSYLSGTMLYSLFGFIGLTYFYLIALELIPYNSKLNNVKLFPLLFFLPMLHFWSSGVGKDTLLFFCIGIFFYGIIKPFKRIPMIVLALLLSYFIRPHMALFMVMGFGLSYMTGSKISKFQRIVFSSAMIIVIILILPSVLKFAKVENASIESFNKFAGDKASLLSRASTGSKIDISSYPFPLKVFTFLFRPLFFDVNGIPSLVASIENLFLLILTIKVFTNNPIKTFKNSPFVIKGLVFFLIIGTLAFSQSLGNLGIMIRMRNMFLPGLLIFILWSLSYKKQVAIEKVKRLKSN